MIFFLVFHCHYLSSILPLVLLATFLFCCLFPAVGFIATKKSLFRKMTGKNRIPLWAKWTRNRSVCGKNKAIEIRYAFCGCSRKSSAWNSPRKWLDGWESVMVRARIEAGVELSVNEWSIDWLRRSDHEGREAVRNERERDREKGRRRLSGIVKADRQGRQCAHASVWEIDRKKWAKSAEACRFSLLSLELQCYFGPVLASSDQCDLALLFSIFWPMIRPISFHKNSTRSSRRNAPRFCNLGVEREGTVIIDGERERGKAYFWKGEGDCSPCSLFYYFISPLFLLELLVRGSRKSRDFSVLINNLSDFF